MNLFDQPYKMEKQVKCPDCRKMIDWPIVNPAGPFCPLCHSLINVVRPSPEEIGEEQFKNLLKQGVLGVYPSDDLAFTKVGVRYDHDKLRWDLVPMHLLEGMVKVLMVGMKKYGNTVPMNPTNLRQLCEKELVLGVDEVRASSPRDYVQPATTSHVASLPVCDAEGIARFEQRVCAIPAMKRFVFSRTQSFRSAGPHTSSGTKSDPTSQKETRPDNERDNLTQPMLNEGKKPTVSDGLRSMDSQKIGIGNSVSEAVNYAALKSGYMLIIAIQQEGSAVFCAVSATTRSDCYKTTLTLLSELHAISGSTPSVRGSEIHIPGAAHNWRKGLNTTRISNSLQRHLNAYMAGEELDPESGLPHVDHILCNALFLKGQAVEHPEMDDRYRRPISGIGHWKPDEPLAREELNVLSAPEGEVAIRHEPWMPEPSLVQ